MTLIPDRQSSGPTKWRAVLGRPSTAVAGALGLTSFLLAWVVGSAATRFIPPLTEVLASIPAFLATGIGPDIVVSAARVTGSLLGALVLGFFAANIMARGRFWGAVVSRYVDLALGLPSTILALLALMIFKRSEIGVIFVVAVACFPFIAINLRQGIATASSQLDGMASVYRLGKWRELRHVTIPHLVPFAMGAVRNEYAHAWRVVVLAEIFAVNSGIGWRFTQAFDRFNIDDVVLWLLTFIVLLLGSEYLILRPLEKLALRWRGDKS